MSVIYRFYAEDSVAEALTEGRLCSKGAITSKIKHAIKLKTSPVLSFIACFILLVIAPYASKPRQDSRTMR